MRRLALLLTFILASCASTTSRQLDRYLTRVVPFGFSGTVLVADARGVVLEKGYGAGIRADTIYDMGSITKVITATAIMQLVAQHQISVDDTLPKYFDGVPAEKRGITVAQLLTHTAGLVDLTGGDYDPVSREQLAHDVLTAPLVSAPGAEWHYSNAGYSLLAAIVEKVSGKPYEQFVRERICAPAGMRDTGYTVAPRDAARVARTYTDDVVDHGTPLDRLQRSGGVHWVLLGNGGLLTTARDLYAFDVALRRNVLLDAATQPTMYTPRIPISGDEQQAYGWHIEPGPLIQHGGDAPELGVNAWLGRYLGDGTSIIVMANSRHNGASTRRAVAPMLRRIMTGEKADVPEVVAVRREKLARYAGTYRLASGATFDVRVDSDHLIVGANGQEAIDALTLQRGEASVAVRRDLDAKAAALYPDAEILGTSRRDRGVLMTTIRRNGEVLRFAWAKGKPVAESDDGALPMVSDVLSRSPITHALERVAWRERGRDGFVFYDLFAGESLRIDFRGDALVIGGVTAIRTT